MRGEDGKCEGDELRLREVVMIPFPAQGHVNSMLQLAELLAVCDIHVSFLNTEYIHDRLLRFADVEARFGCTPTLHFETFWDGLPPEHPRYIHNIGSVIPQIKEQAKAKLTQLCLEHRVSCIIADGMFASLSNQVGRQIGIPVIHFHTVCASCIWVMFNVPNLLPIKGEEDLDDVISNNNIPGMENVLRFRDLPSFCRGSSPKDHPSMEDLVEDTKQTLQAEAVIFNTFQDLEGPVLSEMRLHYPTLYALGPLHAYLDSIKPTKTANTLWEVDRSCMTWLDAQPPKSVIFVSFGSSAIMTREQLMEIWHGLLDSNVRFLWVIRSDMVARKHHGDFSNELVEGTKERGCMVDWAPQQEVLGHVAVGGFMTHCGWNSTLEGVVAGVPMICWPYFGDQQLNSRLVNEVWKVGLDMKDVCDRKVVEKMVNDLMKERREEFVKLALALAHLAKTSVAQGGSSYSDFHRLIQHLKSFAQ